MNRWIDISFDCLPLRSVTRLDVPLDASPKYQEKYQRVLTAIKKHGSHNSYYLHNARAVFHLTNHDSVGMLEFAFEGTVLTNPSDETSRSTDIEVELLKETCDWLTEPIVDWFCTTVGRAVMVEFDRYITAGDLAKTKERIANIEASSDDAGGFVGMYL